jgi:GTP-binding protein EngB required for normal cell division
VGQARSVAQRAQARRGLSEQLTVVAFAGSTGAGKSTLFNSIVGEEVAKAGVLRPTTSEPLAAIWQETPETLALLEWLGVTRWHVAADGAAALADLVLIDLPDHDSTQSSHRAHVDHFVERVDLMVWVLDPQKYADALVHEQYLRRFARHDDVTVVVLNQVDKLAVADAQQCLAHLKRLVAEDGLSDAVVLGASNRSGEGLEALADRILTAVASRRTAVARLAADVATAADGLARAADDPGAPIAGAGTGDLNTLTDALTEAAGAPVIEAAIEKSSQLKAVQAVGWPPLKWLSGLRKDPVAQLRLERAGVDPRLVRSSLPSNDPVAKARANSAVLDYVDKASAGAPQAWVQSTRAVADRASAGLADQPGRHPRPAGAAAGPTVVERVRAAAVGAVRDRGRRRSVAAGVGGVGLPAVTRRPGAQCRGLPGSDADAHRRAARRGGAGRDRADPGAQQRQTRGPGRAGGASG